MRELCTERAKESMRDKESYKSMRETANVSMRESELSTRESQA